MTFGSEPRPNSPSDPRSRCVNCQWLSTSNGYTFCGNDNGPIGHVNFGCGDDVANEIQNVWCSGFEPQDWIAKQGVLFGSGTDSASERLATASTGIPGTAGEKLCSGGVVGQPAHVPLPERVETAP